MSLGRDRSSVCLLLFPVDILWKEDPQTLEKFNYSKVDDNRVDFHHFMESINIRFKL